jgi:hypothetical protein
MLYSYEHIISLFILFDFLKVPIPPRPVDHRARFDGWNFDPRWNQNQASWDGKKYHRATEQTVAAKGDRPITGFFGRDFLDNKTAVVQFVEANKKVAGNIFVCFILVIIINSF